MVTHCMATRGRLAAVVDRGGNAYLSLDAGRSWSRIARGLPAPSGIELTVGHGEP